jgi:hypothetical protein
MEGVRGMEEKGGGASAGERGGDFASDQAGFAHASNDYAAFAGEEEVYGFFEGGVKAVEDVSDGLGFDFQDAAGGVEAQRAPPLFL